MRRVTGRFAGSHREPQEVIVVAVERLIKCANSCLLGARDLKQGHCQRLLEEQRRGRAARVQLVAHLQRAPDDRRELDAATPAHSLAEDGAEHLG